MKFSANYGIAVGGKTGTAQVGNGSNNAVFIAFAPFDDPQIAVSVVLEHGVRGTNAAQVAKDIFDKYFNLDSADTTARAYNRNRCTGRIIEIVIIWGGLIKLEKELIKLKGTADGVKIYLDSECEFSKLMNSLYEKIRQFRKFFGGGRCNIYVVGRELSTSDKMQSCRGLLRLCCRNVR